ncbi:MAG: hypothetical protein LBV00_13280, partial [Propionibacteriaceae bacterium]|nr:hypothetical protein [Propionibacteriaceae bacterium]
MLESRPSVSFVFIDGQFDYVEHYLLLMMQRLKNLASTESWSYTQRYSEGFSSWAARYLPIAGVLVVDLVHATARANLDALATLNLLRTRLLGGGACVVLAPPYLQDFAILRAPDLWSIVSFARLIEPSVAAQLPKPRVWDDAITMTHEITGPWRPPTIVVPEALFDQEAKNAINDINAIYRSLPDNPIRARQQLHDMTIKGYASHIGLLFVNLASAAVESCSGASTDLVDSLIIEAVNEVEGAASSLDQPAADSFALRTYDSIFRHSNSLGIGLDVSRRLVDRERTRGEDLNRQLGTPESARDLSVSLDNVAKVALRRGDLGVAEQT